MFLTEPGKTRGEKERIWIMGKMKLCKSCGKEIAANAKTCPFCGGKNKKPIYKRFWFWLLIVIIAIIALAAGGGSDEPSGKIGEVSEENTEGSSKTAETKETGTKEAPTKEESTVPAKAIYNVGDILAESGTQIVYAAAGVYHSDNQFMQPAEGKQYLFFRLAFINGDDAKEINVSYFDFDCYADGYTCEQKYITEQELSANLTAGRQTEGCVYFEVPKDAKEVQLEYEVNMFSNKKILFLYEEKDSGFKLEKKTTPTAGALKPGESVKGTELTVTYLSCFESHSDNMFITPAEGNRFVTCEFEFENTSSSDKSVTTLNFDCYADGSACDFRSFRDDDLSATLSSRRKAKGTVTFEVPADAAVVEIEYRSNLFSAKRVIFDASDLSK